MVRILSFTAVLGCVATGLSCSSRAGGNSAIPVYSMGDRAQAGPLIYTVFESKWAPQLGSEATARIPANRFLLLRTSVVNSSSAEANVPTLSLVDDNGQRYPELVNGDEVPQWIGFVRRVRPADTLTGNLVFDVPLKHYRLEVTEENDEKKALVDIPLSFGVENVPMPGMPSVTQNPGGVPPAVKQK